MTDTPEAARQPRNPLHGVTLEAMLTALVAHFGWAELGARVQINSFNTDPSISSSLKFLRRTAWAREKVEGLYLFMQREQAREARESTARAKQAGTAPRPATSGDASMPTSAPFGAWTSPVTAELIAGATIRLGQTALRGAAVFWTEGRPQEQGRNALVQWTGDGPPRDVVAAPFNVRSRAHEYGGGAFVLLPDGVVFSHDEDQQLWRVDAGGTPLPLTREPGTRYADAVFDTRRRRLIAVREDHRTTDGAPAGAAASASLVAVDLASGAVETLVTGHDFFSSPCLGPDGRQLAWLAWNHPNMPWDGTELWLADLDDAGRVTAPRRVAGGADESVFQPSWSPAGALHFVSDRSGWWNLWRLGDGDAAVPLHPRAAEFGEAQWAFGMSSYGFDGEGRIVCIVREGGAARLARLDVGAGRLETLTADFPAMGELRVGADFAVFVGATAREPAAVVRWDFTTGRPTVLRASSSASIDPAFVAVAEPIAFDSDASSEDHAASRAHAFFYPPTNPNFTGPPGERPPLIVIGHGGPTGATDAGFKWPIQFWTSRGFGVVDVNYGGSTGFGRAYRERLNGRWGVVDVADSIRAARHLVARGDADAGRLVIRGASAGGYTTLCALAFHRVFAAGASHYGIGDLETLVRDTHKFESRYLDRLVGPYPAERALYVARSPIHHVERLAAPMILFQGTEDRAVPPAQAQAMFDAVDAKGLPVALLMFDGEQHGFRRAATIRRVLQAELYFYGRVFGFEPAETIEVVEIRNLPER